MPEKNEGRQTTTCSTHKIPLEIIYGEKNFDDYPLGYFKVDSLILVKSPSGSGLKFSH